MIQQTTSTPAGEKHRSRNRIGAFILHVLLPVAALACGIAITLYLMNTTPEATPRKRPPTATLVETRQLIAAPQQTTIRAMGEIIPAIEIQVQPRVSGEVVSTEQEFVPGGFFTAGDLMLNIDPTDYQLVIDQLESEVAQARSDIALELGNQRVAELEYSFLDEQVSVEEEGLILRKPQMEKLTAGLKYAEARLSGARLDLERTRITAPFNSVVASRDVNIGAKVNESTVLASLVGTDAFWLRLTLPVEQLPWISMPTSGDVHGATVNVFPQTATAAPPRTGQVVRLSASLEQQGRMAQLLVRIDDPLCLKPENYGKPKLLLGSYLQAEIIGNTIDRGIRVDRQHVHEGNRIWLMDSDGSLVIQPVDILFRNRDSVVITADNLDGQQLITSSLSAPIAGIPLRLAASEAAASRQPARPESQASAGSNRRAADAR